MSLIYPTSRRVQVKRLRLHQYFYANQIHNLAPGEIESEVIPT